jgi:hypothetical protein
MFVGPEQVLQPIIDKRFRNRLEDLKRIAAVSDLKKWDSLFDEPL